MDLRCPSATHYSRTRMKGYGQFCPVAKAAEIVAERWTPLVLRELLCGSRRFSDLHRGVPLMSRTLLASGLWQLEKAGIVQSVAKPRDRGREYHLTAAGEELRPLIECFGEWGQRWARAQVDRVTWTPGLLMWNIHRRQLEEDSPVVPPELRHEPRLELLDTYLRCSLRHQRELGGGRSRSGRREATWSLPVRGDRTLIPPAGARPAPGCGRRSRSA
jgi:DNA-binding HxlR family transcriptional regulator